MPKTQTIRGCILFDDVKVDKDQYVPRDAMLSQDVRPSVCLSHAAIVKTAIGTYH